MRIGIDLGGTKTEIVVLDDKGHQRFKKRIKTDKKTYQTIVNGIVQLVDAAESHLQQRCSIGLCIPGTIDNQRQVVKNANTTILNDQPLAKDLSKTLHRPVRIANDANCLALSEAFDGAAAGAAVVFGVIVGTGCGGGLVINGKIVEGANGLTGEWGHNRLNDLSVDEHTSHRCYCGQTGCIETWVSGKGMARHYRDAAINLGLLNNEDQGPSAEDIVALASTGDELAEQQIKLLENRMARALSQIINIIDPDVIVLGGGLSNMNRLYENIPSLWQNWVFSEHVVNTKLVRARYGDASGVRGAAWLWPQK